MNGYFGLITKTEATFLIKMCDDKVSYLSRTGEMWGKGRIVPICTHVSLINAAVSRVPQNARMNYRNERMKSVTRHSLYHISLFSLKPQGLNNSFKIFIKRRRKGKAAPPNSSLIIAACEFEGGGDSHRPELVGR